MLTGGTIIDSPRSPEWIGNQNGCGIMNNMCQFGDMYGSEAFYYVEYWGSRTKLSLFLSA